MSVFRLVDPGRPQERLMSAAAHTLLSPRLVRCLIAAAVSGTLLLLVLWIHGMPLDTWTWCVLMFVPSSTVAAMSLDAARPRRWLATGLGVVWFYLIAPSI